MAWETDRHGTTRYVQKIRIKGRVTSKVLGTGQDGHRAEQTILLKRETKRQLQEEDKRIQTVFHLYEQIVKKLAEQSLINQGFVKRKSVWQRVSRLNTPLTPKEKAHIKHVKSILGPHSHPPSIPMLKQLTSYGTKILNDQELSDVRNLLRSDPNLWRTIGDVATWPRKYCLSIVPEGTVQSVCVQSGMTHMRKQLLRDGDSEIERILVEQIITCWLKVGTTSYQLEILEPNQENSDQIKRLERRYDLDQARLTRTLALLDRIRRSMLDDEIKKYRNRSLDQSIFSWEQRKSSDEPNNPSKEITRDEEKPSSESAEQASPIPTSTDIPTVSPKIEDFIQRSSDRQEISDDHEKRINGSHLPPGAKR